MDIAANGMAHSSFTADGGGSEHFISVHAPPHLGLADQIAHLEAAYDHRLKALGLAPETAVFRRLFVSDVLNQAPLLTRSALYADSPQNPVAVSLVQQPPLPGSKLSMLAYHVECAVAPLKKRLSRNHVLMEKNGLRHLWSTRLCASDDHGRHTVQAQTCQVFDDLIRTLAHEGGTLRGNCVRTWIYLKDVDVFYQGMVDSRRDLFACHGLTPASHYIASTGIEGACAHRHDLVAMDAYSVVGMEPEQVSYLNDFDRLCPTRDYGVTFERGTRIGYADRAHSFISGTASIDRNGQVLHLGDVMRQLDRALENVDALLGSGGARLADMKYLIVYLRDPADYAPVKSYLDLCFPGLPVLVVEGAVCRPEWLIEVEGLGVTRNDETHLPAF